MTFQFYWVFSKEALRGVILCGNSRRISLVHMTSQRQLRMDALGEELDSFYHCHCDYWTGPFPVISSTLTLILKVFSTGSLYFKSFLVWEEKRKRKKWNFWSALLKKACSFRTWLPSFYSKFLFCEAKLFVHIQTKKNICDKYKTHHWSVLNNINIFSIK